MNLRKLYWLSVLIVLVFVLFPPNGSSLGSPPVLIIFLLMSILGALGLEAHYWQQRRRLRLGLCLRCGHGLRSRAEPCPNCGATIPPPAGGDWSTPIPRILRAIVILQVLYVSWLAMMAVHESGHVLHAWISGGKVSLVYFRPLDFSRTELSINPHPQFVAWGGPIWGSILPLGAYGLVYGLRLGCRKFALFFAGLCLVVNGAYVGIGWTLRAGDAGTLLSHGASSGVMALTGLSAMGLGLYLWHRLGPRFGLGADTKRNQPLSSTKA